MDLKDLLNEPFGKHQIFDLATQVHADLCFPPKTLTISEIKQRLTPEAVQKGIIDKADLDIYMFSAIEYGREDIVHYLSELGVSDQIKHTAILIALVDNGDAKNISGFISHPDFEGDITYGKNRALEHAITSSNVTIAKILVKHGADAQEAFHESPIFEILRDGDESIKPEMITWLAEKGTPINEWIVEIALKKASENSDVSPKPQ